MKLVISAILLVFSLLVGTIPNIVFALEYGGIGGKPALPDPSNPRTKSIFIFTLEPGQGATNKLLVVNNSPERKTMEVYAADSERGSDGAFACKQKSDTPKNVGSWIKLAKTEVTLDSGTNEIIDFEINVAENASVGEENGCILIQEKKEFTEDGKSGISLSFRTGLRVVVTIPGEQIRKLTIKDFQAAVSTEKGKIVSNFQIENQGNVSIDAKIYTRIKSVLGTNIDGANNLSNQYPVLRNDLFQLNNELEFPFWGGFFNVYGEVEYDQSKNATVGLNTEGEKTILTSNYVTVFVMPASGAIIFYLLVLTAIVIIIIFLYRKRKFNQSIATIWIEYWPKKGDSIMDIAKMFKTDWKKLVSANKLKPPYTLDSEKALKVPPTT